MYVADIPPETEEERREREKFEKELEMRESYERKRSDSYREGGFETPSHNKNPGTSHAQDQHVKRNVSRSPHGYEDRGGQEISGVEKNIREGKSSTIILSENESLPICYKSGESQRSPIATVGVKIGSNAQTSIDFLKDNVVSTTKKSEKLSSFHGNDSKLPEEERSRKKSKTKKAKKTKKSKKEHSEVNHNKRVKKNKSKQNLEDFKEELMKKLGNKPLVPYADSDDTATDDSIKSKETKEGPMKKRETDAIILTEGVKNSKKVSKQRLDFNDLDSQFSRKAPETSSISPGSRRWDMGNENISEDPGVQMSNQQVENTGPQPQEFALTENIKCSGGRNMLRRALA